MPCDPVTRIQFKVRVASRHVNPWMSLHSPRQRPATLSRYCIVASAASFRLG